MPKTLRRLDVEDIGDVTLVTFLIPKLLDEQTIQLIGEELFRLADAGKRRKIVISFERVEYASSAIFGKLITMHQKVVIRGKGQLAFAGIPAEVQEVFEMTRLNRFFSLYDSVAEAIAAFAGAAEAELRVACPVSGCQGIATADAKLSGAAHLRCPECQARFEVLLPEVSADAEASATVQGVRLPTHEGQEAELVGGPLFTLRVPARLDLFAWDVLKRLWESVPPPRRVVIDCRRSNEISPQGAAALAAAVSRESGDLAAILLAADGPRGLFPAELLAADEEDAERVAGSGAADVIRVRVSRPPA